MSHSWTLRDGIQDCSAVVGISSAVVMGGIAEFHIVCLVAVWMSLVCSRLSLFFCSHPWWE